MKLQNSSSSQPDPVKIKYCGCNDETCSPDDCLFCSPTGYEDCPVCSPFECLTKCKSCEECDGSGECVNICDTQNCEECVEFEENGQTISRCESKCGQNECCKDGVCSGCRECCLDDNSCSGFCPKPVCDNNPLPGQTPDGAPCCDGVCIACGDCGDGGEECCNSIELMSIFDNLSDQAEYILISTADTEIHESFGHSAISAWNDYVKNIRFGNNYKFSIMLRSYLIDALYAIESGADPIETMNIFRQQWTQFANTYRGVIND